MAEDPPPTAPAGWYPHPSMAQTVRYWDGGTWTDQVAPAAGGTPGTLDDPDAVPCGYCGKRIKLGSTRCPHCAGGYLWCKKCKIAMPFTTTQKFVGIARGGTKPAHWCRKCGAHVGGVRW